MNAEAPRLFCEGGTEEEKQIPPTEKGGERSRKKTEETLAQIKGEGSFHSQIEDGTRLYMGACTRRALRSLDIGIRTSLVSAISKQFHDILNYQSIFASSNIQTISTLYS